MFKIILKTKIDITCEIKISSRWHKVTGNKWVTAIEPNHLNDWIIQERITLMLLRDTKLKLQLFGIKKNCRRNGAKTGKMVSKT